MKDDTRTIVKNSWNMQYFFLVVFCSIHDYEDITYVRTYVPYISKIILLLFKIQYSTVLVGVIIYEI